MRSDEGARRAALRHLETSPITPALVCLVVAAVSLVLPGAPTYDPWSWLIWGREVTSFDLSTTGGPAWKPLPVIFTAAFSFAGGLAPALWLVIARGGAVLAVVMAYRLARRLAGRTAGLVASAALLSSAGFLGYLVPLGMSEPLLAGLVLWAVERHLDGCRRWAFALGLAAALLRPEVWPFLVLYGAFLWRTDRRDGWLVGVGLAALPLLWFLPDLWGSGDLLRSSHRAQIPNPGDPALAEFPGLEVLKLARHNLGPPVNAGALAGAVMAVILFATRRTEKTTVLIAAAAAAWVGIVVVMTQMGLAAGELRFLIVAAALACVLAGVACGRLVELGGILAARFTRRPELSVIGRVVATVLLLLIALPYAVPRIRELRSEAGEVRYQAALYDDLPAAIRQLGGRTRVVSCGPLYTNALQVPALAWHLRVHFPQVGFAPRPPGTVFSTRNGRWAPLDPPAGPEELPLPLVAKAGEWEVRSSCDSLRRAT